MKLFLPDNYITRAHPAYYDDTENTDNWQREVYFLAKQLAIKLNIKEVVDYGCGSAFKLRKNFIGSEISIRGVDLPPTVSVLRERYPSEQWQTAAEFDFETLKKDSMLICSDVIEHMNNPLPFMHSLAASNVGVVVLSTPARELLVEGVQTNRLGPPANSSHVCEWSCKEFHNFVAQFFSVSEHSVSNVLQATQFVVAYHKSNNVNKIKIFS